MIFRSPVTRPLHGSEWKRPPGNIDFRVTQVFGCTGYAAEPPLGTCKHFHRAIDMGNGRSGDDVVAAAAGKVRFANWLNLGGIAVLIDHGNGWWTEYAHLRSGSLTVKAGSKVVKGQRIGRVGSTGATAAHLHFGCQRDRTISNLLPAWSVANRYYDDSKAHWQDPWPLLEQNVRIHLKADDGIRVRTKPELGDTIYAATKAGQIIRADGKDLGPAAQWRDWGGRVIGAQYPINGTTDNRWDRIALDGKYLFVATPLAVLSA